MTRRESFVGLFAAPTIATGLSGKPLKHRKADKAPNTLIYRGPIEIPSHVAEAIRECPDLAKSRGGANKLVSRYTDADGILYRGRCPIPAHRGVVGEIVSTAEGIVRVHWWAAATPAPTYRTPADLIARRNGDLYEAGRSRIIRGPIMPPLMPPASAWSEELPAEYQQYVDGKA